MTDPTLRKRLIRIALFAVWGLSLAGLAWWSWQNRADLLPYLQESQPIYFLYGFGWYLCSLSAVLVGWVLIMRVFAPAFPWRSHIWIYAVTLAARRLPGTLWYVGGRMVLYQERDIGRRVTTVASGVEWAVMLVTSVILSLLLIPSSDVIPQSATILMVVSAIAGLIWLLAGGFEWVLLRLKTELPTLVPVMTKLAWLAVYIVAWLTGGAILVMCVRAYTVLAAADVVYVVGVWMVSSAAGLLVFFLPSNFGVGEVTMTVMLGQIMPLPLAGIVTVTVRLLTTLFEVLLVAFVFPLQNQLNRADDRRE